MVYKKIHKIDLDGHVIVLKITHDNGYWKCKPSCDTSELPIGEMFGGEFKSVDEYIENCVSSVTYAWNFFNYGYKHAKKQYELDKTQSK